MRPWWHTERENVATATTKPVLRWYLLAYREDCNSYPEQVGIANRADGVRRARKLVTDGYRLVEMYHRVRFRQVELGHETCWTWDEREGAL